MSFSMKLSFTTMFLIWAASLSPSLEEQTNCRDLRILWRVGNHKDRECKVFERYFVDCGETYLHMRDGIVMYTEDRRGIRTLIQTSVTPASKVVGLYEQEDPSPWEFVEGKPMVQTHIRFGRFCSMDSNKEMDCLGLNDWSQSKQNSFSAQRTPYCHGRTPLRNEPRLEMVINLRSITTERISLNLGLGSDQARMARSIPQDEPLRVTFPAEITKKEEVKDEVTEEASLTIGQQILQSCSVYKFKENCIKSRGKRSAHLEDLITDLQTNDDWDYTLAVDGLSSLQSLIETSSGQQYTYPDFETYKHRCRKCMDKAFGIELSNHEKISIVHSAVGKSQKVLKRDCRSLEPRTQACDKHTPNGPMDQLVCSKLMTTDEEKEQFHKMDHQIEVDVCSIGNATFNDCKNTAKAKRKYSVGIIGNKFKLFHQSQLQIRTTHNDPRSYKSEPESCKDDCFEGSVACSGDEYFCGFKGCAQKSDCYVSYDPQYSSLDIITGLGELVRVQCVYQIVAIVKYRIPNSLKKKERSEKIKEVKDELDVSCEPEGILVKSSKLKLVSSVACSGSHCIKTMVEDSKILIKLPSEVRLRQHSVNIKLIIHQVAFPIDVKEVCPGVDGCELIRCNFCWNRIMNPSCYTTIDYIILVLMASVFSLILAVIALLMMLYQRVADFVHFVYRSVAFIMRGIKILTKFLFCKAWELTTTGTNKLSKMVNNDAVRRNSDDIESQRPTSSSISGNRDVYRQRVTARDFMARLNRRTYRIDPKVKPSPISGVLVVAVALLIKSSEQCTITNTFEAATSHCKYNPDGSLSDCLISNSVETVLSGVGVESCLKLTSKNGHNLGFMKISLVDIVERCTIGSTYFVPDVKSKLEYQQICHMSGLCRNDNCESTKKSGTSMPFDYQKTTNPGMNGCMRGAGFLFEGCLSPLESCLFYRHYLTNPTERFGKVFKCSKWTTGIKIKVQYIQEKSELSFSKDVKIISGQEATIDKGITIQLHSLSKLFHIDITECFMSMEGSLHYLPCNEREVFTIGNLGEVQCPSEQSAKELGNQCKFDDRMFTTIVQDTTLKDDTKTFSILKSLDKGTELPLHIGDFILSEESGNPVLDIDPATQVTISVKFDSAKATVASMVGSCSVEFISVSGCYSCRSGALVVVKSTAVQAPVLTTIKCGVTEVQFVSQPKEMTHNLHISFSSPKISSNCSYNCGEKIGFFMVRGDLHYASLSDKLSDDSSTIDKGLHNGKLFGILGWSLFDFTHGYFGAIIIIWIVISVIWCFYMLKNFVIPAFIKKVT